jgi:hypothetical protein
MYQEEMALAFPERDRRLKPEKEGFIVLSGGGGDSDNDQNDE